MRFAKQIVMTVLGIALVAYALDCSAMVTPQHAVECCQSMGCSSQGHTSEDCCKTMPAMHAPFVQPSSPLQHRIAGSAASSSRSSAARYSSVFVQPSSPH